MNFDQAITEHSAWKERLANYLIKPDRSLDSSELALDNKCDLGQWIYGEGAKFEQLPDYTRLKREHARFHEVVGRVVHDAESKRSEGADAALAPNCEFAQASSAVVLAILFLKQRIPV